jgi:subtilase family serine protease
MIKQIARFISYSVVGLSALLIAVPSTFAAQPRHGKAPYLAIGPQATLSTHATPQYGLFTCQVGLFFVSPTEQAFCYDPYQMQHAYNVDSLIAAGYDGTGHTIVVVDAFQAPTLMSDLDAFNSFYGLSPDLSFFSQIAPFGLGPPNLDWAGEITLDVEWSHAIAPGAKIVLVLAKSNDDQDILNAVKYAVDNNLGDVISMSFGENESCVDPTILSTYHDVFAAATMKNITLFASSGDEGAAQMTCDGNSWVKAASSPASDPLVTAVGGTELSAAGYCFTFLGCDPSTYPAPGTYLSEMAWNEGPPYGDYQDQFASTIATGGGFSVLFDEPPYQKGTGGLHGGKQRAVPDVAYNAAVLHGVLVFFLGDVFLFGGTSAGSPQWAAITAIADQKAGHRLGFLNSAIYQIGKVNKAYPASFNDVLTGTNSAVEFDSSNNPVNIVGFSAGTGWDATTGTGSPIATSMVDYLIRYVSPGDGQAAISTTKPKPHPKPIVPGSMDPH